MTRYAEIEKALRNLIKACNHPAPQIFGYLANAHQDAQAALALPEDSKPFAWFHRETGALRFADLQQMADARKLPQVETPLYTAPAKEDSKTVNAELYGLAVKYADKCARWEIEDFCDRDFHSFDSFDTTTCARVDADTVKDALRYLELRESSGEPMPYRVVRDGDKVRFL